MNDSLSRKTIQNSSINKKETRNKSSEIQSKTQGSFVIHPFHILNTK